MQNKVSKTPPYLLVLLAFIAVININFWVQEVIAQEEGHFLNLRDADIRALIDDISMVTGNLFIVDPRVKGKITVISHVPLKENQLFQVFLSTLRVHGFSAVETPTGAYRIVPMEAAIQDGMPLNNRSESGDFPITEIFQLEFVDGAETANLLRPALSPTGQVLSTRGSGTLIVVDFATNMDRIRTIISEVDRDLSEMRQLLLENTSALEMANTVTSLLRSTSEGSERAPRLTALAVESSNTLILRGELAQINRFIPIIQQLDKNNENRGGVRVVYLKYATAEEMVPLLQQISQSLALEGGQSNTSRTTITSHKPTNALIINADPEMLQMLESVIFQLDIRRAQVLVEAIIVEVSDTAARQLGVQYILSGGEGSNVPFSVSNYSNAAPNLLAATGALVLDRENVLGDEALNQLQSAAVNSLVGLNGFSAGFAGTSNNGTLFGMILNAVEQDNASNVLSTPSIMTMDNEPAKIIVGQEIPITTGEALGSNNVNPFRTIERENVGIQLEVEPQINESGSIELAIRQEVSTISGPVSENFSELITNKREISTTVMVDNGEIIVLGGLIEENEQEIEEKVPFLGDIPILGQIFRNNSKSKQRTNLMVFLRPTIIYDSDEARAVTNRKYELIRNEQIKKTGGESSLEKMLLELGAGNARN